MQINTKKNLFILIGASHGLGKALYEEIFSQDGNDIILVNRTKIVSNNIKTVQEIRCDLSKPLSEKKLSDIFSKISKFSYNSMTLVCNASVLGSINFVGTLGQSEIEELWNVNIVNHSFFINAFIKCSRKYTASRKRILTISSGAAVSSHDSIAMYCATKAGLEMLVRAIFEEQKTAQCVEIAAVRPGVMDTNMQKHIRNASVKYFHDVQKYKKMKTDKKLLSSSFVAQKLYTFLSQQKQWKTPVVDIEDL